MEQGCLRTDRYFHFFVVLAADGEKSKHQFNQTHQPFGQEAHNQDKEDTQEQEPGRKQRVTEIALATLNEKRAQDRAEQ